MKAKRMKNGGLILERGPTESFTLTDKRDGAVLAVVTVTKVQGNRSWLHTNAPEHVGIVRTELLKGKTDVPNATEAIQTETEV
jgi:sRNA-binding carbon storage regulator CsrA